MRPKNHGIVNKVNVNNHDKKVEIVKELRDDEKRALEKTNALVYNLLRKVIGCNIRFALSNMIFIKK